MTTTPDLTEVLDEPVELTDLARYLGRRGATFADSDDETFARLAVDAAHQLVAQLLSSATGELSDDLPPQQTMRLAVLVVASELWERKNSRANVMSFGPDGQATVRLSWDTLRAVRPLLAPYTVAL